MADDSSEEEQWYVQLNIMFLNKAEALRWVWHSVIWKQQWRNKKDSWSPPPNSEVQAGTRMKAFRWQTDCEGRVDVFSDDCRHGMSFARRMTVELNGVWGIGEWMYAHTAGGDWETWGWDLGRLSLWAQTKEKSQYLLGRKGTAHHYHSQGQIWSELSFSKPFNDILLLWG